MFCKHFPTTEPCTVHVRNRFGRTEGLGTFTSYPVAMFSLDPFSEWAEFTTMPLTEVALDIARKLGAV